MPPEIAIQESTWTRDHRGYVDDWYRPRAHGTECHKYRHGTLSTPQLDRGQSVEQFALSRGISAHLEEAIGLARRVFPSGTSLSTRVESDPDSGEQWIVVDVWSNGMPLDEALAAEDRYLETIVTLIPPAAISAIRLVAQF